jgi:DNA-binding NarL/FixJ family response regulator
MASKLKLLIGDKCRLLCDGLKSIIHNEGGYIVVDTLADGEALINSAMKYKPDIIITDCFLPKVSGIEACSALNSAVCRVKFLFLSEIIDQEIQEKCLKVGGYGLLNKDVTKSLLLYALQNISEGNKYFVTNKNNYDEIKTSPDHLQDLSRLTRQEKYILELVEAGLTSKNIAEKCHISKRTVDVHRYHISHKLTIPFNEIKSNQSNQ